jgi:RNase P subunit RPR2
MTVRLVEEPPNAYRAICKKCRAKFSYQLSDLRTNYRLAGDCVACPQCSETHRHPDQRAAAVRET